MKNHRLVVAALVGWLFVGLLSAAPQFVPGPSARTGASMAYDEQRDVIVLFGGESASGVRSDETWEWSGGAWSLMTPSHSPPAVTLGSMIYDTLRGVCVFFGGSPANGAASSETWEWDGVDWIQRVLPVAPSARHYHAMAYDVAHGCTLLYGGQSGQGQVFADHWSYDGAAWTQQAGASAPGPKTRLKLAFDSTRGQVVMFGGRPQSSNSGGTSNATWVWDGASWLQQSPVQSPPGRASMVLVDAKQLGVVLCHGGHGNNWPATNATWAWDGSDWSLLPTNIGPARGQHAGAWDEGSSTLVVFGGQEGASGGGATDETWTFDGSRWSPALAYVASPVNGHRYALTPPMTWQDAENLAVLEGGHLATVRNQAEQGWLVANYGFDNHWIGFTDEASEGLWYWASGEPAAYTNWAPGEPSNGLGAEHYAHLNVGTGGTWNDTVGSAMLRGIIELPGGPVGELTASVANTVAPQPLRGAEAARLPSGGALSFGGDVLNGPFFPTYEWTNSGWNKQFSFNNPMVRTGHSLILDEASQNNVLFGGVNPAGTKLADTWTYQGGQWTYLTPANAPPARSEHAMAYDPTSNVGVLFGGEDAAGTALNDMWAWDGSDWSQTTPATLPPARSGHGLAYDRYRSRLVLFGGTAGATRLNDIWEWDGTDWSQITPAQPSGVAYGPSGRDGFVMAYDPRSERVVVVGGETDSGCVDEVWSWDGAGWLRHYPSSGSTLPSARKDAAIFVDAVTNELRMFGGGCGSEFSDELWELQLPVFARSEVIGVGCAGSNGVPALSVANGASPVLGAQVDFDYTNGPTLQGLTPVIAVGFDDQSFGGLPLPLPLAVLGLPGCTLYHSADVIQAASVTAVSGEFAYSLPLPNNSNFLGTELYLQGLHYDFSPLTSWAALSNAVGIRIGDQ